MMAASVPGCPKPWRLGRQKQEPSLSRGRVHTGLPGGSAPQKGVKMSPSSVSHSTSPVSQRRWSVVQSLQTVALRFSPASLEADSAERGILLALSDARDDRVPAFLYRNALRDGRKLTCRRRARELSFDPTDQDSDPGKSLAYGLIQEFADVRNTPEDLAVAHDFRAKLDAEVVRSSGAEGRICLEGLLSGASIGESAAESGLSARQVRHTRSRIRATAAQFLGEAA